MNTIDRYIQAQEKDTGVLPIGGTFWFEYHCWEDPKSCDAELWYRSHQQVGVLGLADVDPDAVNMTLEERIEATTPLVYRVRFPDGHVGDAWEDELLDDPSQHQRPDPPERPSK